MQVDAYLITKDRLLAPVDVRSMSDEWFFDDTVRWIKITSATPQEVEQALRPLELEPRIVQACVHPQPPQVKQAGPSVLEACAGKSVYSNHGQRVVAGCHLMQ